ncbi:glycosyltransferase family 4 protein [Pseudohalocynthiibacter aestuariivivens]|jgi:mannosyltransferase|uniref:Glycosyltransferase family 4 protein n=1 Tax=Pseudohalocynthiibacter aestuariivivens TaxID=1591409 RepID=A0ABV5JBT8_9RHOB|nr:MULTISPECIES: glycosyltransferase family 4 protein [Pseudohalocynthiibacter]MBS9718664.1 glycosyltransferase family 4 protein [Pseudohalocynthiibacter aestuariivivens]MCK0104140.1 glycosyltransferase family 4 protein [Pseudohalocynthiibacter sp. F2068]
MPPPELYVTNFNKNFTGVSATTAGVVAVQQDQFDMRLVGQPLPHCPVPISKQLAYKLSRKKPPDRPFSIWHVRRNPEMRAALWARDVLRLPIKIVFTSAAQRLHSAYPRWLISNMDAVIATTPEAASFVSNVHAVVSHGVDTNQFRPAQNRSSAWRMLGYGGTFGLAAVGRIRPEKGTDIFVEAMLEVLPKHPDLVALIVGKTAKEHLSFKRKLESRIESAGLSNRLVFTGEVKPDKMPALMRALTLLVALPRYEGYGMTPLEALASGAPFIGTETGYFQEFSNDGQLGTVVGTENSAKAAAAVEAWFANPGRLSKASEIAPGFVKQQHSIEREVAGINAVYEGLWAQ